MKVCILTETFHPVVGGGESQARSLADELVSRGHGVVILTRRTDKLLPARESLEGIQVHRIGPSGRSHLSKWGLTASVVPALIRLRAEFDVLLVSGFRVVGASAVAVARQLGKPSVLKADSLGEMSGRFFEAGLRRLRLSTESAPVRTFLWFRNRRLLKASAFVAISEAVRDELLRNKVDPQRIHAIPNSVDVERFHPVDNAMRLALRRKLQLPERASIVTYTGRLVTYKGLPLLLRVWSELSRGRPNALLLLVGAGGLDIHNCESELKHYVGGRGLQSSVVFTGAVTNVQEYLQASDVFVFPTEREAFGISLLEAMACGLPTISTRVGGVKDILEGEAATIAINVDDHNQLLDALEKVMSDSELASRLGAAGRQLAMSRYSSSAIAESYLRLFDQLRECRL